MKKWLLLPLVLFSTHTLAQFSNESELGIASANGNTKTQTFTFKQVNDYKVDRNVFSLRSRYLNASANGVETARFFMLGLKYELEVSSRFGLFVGEALEKDKFANIDQRLITDAGGRYRFIDSDDTKFFSELGYRYMDEQRLDDTNAYSNYGRFFTEWSNNWNKNFSTKYWVEYLPNFTELTDWQLNTELSLTAILNSVFSLKSGVLVRYDHDPAPGIIYKTDTLFTTSLVAKF
jgi:putative salt-induced outer membrane protein